MYIIKKGKYPENNKADCKECNCRFKYYNSEIHVDVTDPDMSAFLGGIGVTKYVECPQCKSTVIIDSEFYEETSIICEGIKKFVNKIKIIFKKKGNDNNGNNENK